MNGPFNSRVTFVENVVVRCQEDIGSATVYVAGIFIGRGKCRIAGIRLASEGKFHVRDSDVRSLHPAADMLKERPVAIGHLPFMKHHIADDEH